MKILVIQTAFIGDVVLATALIESLALEHPAQLDVLVRKGNESLFENNPHVNEVLIWNKKEGKFKNLFALLKRIRKEKYDAVINLQRFASSGILTAFSKAKNKVGYAQNPLSFLFTRRVVFSTSSGKHEIERNFELAAPFVKQLCKPKLYPSVWQFEKVSAFKTSPYITVSPKSVWFTKQWPKELFVRLCQELSATHVIYFLGAKSDSNYCAEIAHGLATDRFKNLCGELSFLESAALMRDAKMNFVNDSAPMHFASAMNAPTTALYCSTLPSFGFGPLADGARVIENEEQLACRPCGLHGLKACPKGHFKCGQISNEQWNRLLQP